MRAFAFPFTAWALCPYFSRLPCARARFTPAMHVENYHNPPPAKEISLPRAGTSGMVYCHRFCINGAACALVPPQSLCYTKAVRRCLPALRTAAMAAPHDGRPRGSKPCGGHDQDARTRPNGLYPCSRRICVYQQEMLHLVRAQNFAATAAFLQKAYAQGGFALLGGQKTPCSTPCAWPRQPRYLHAARAAIFRRP